MTGPRPAGTRISFLIKNGCVEQVFNLDCKDQRWGKRKLKRDR